MIDYNFVNKDLLVQAFTHSSYANENNCEDYERLEFLGDSVLEALTTMFLYKHFSDNEGMLSKMRAKVVSATSLCSIITQLGLVKYIRVGGSIGKNIPTNIIADVFESIVAGIYLDKGIDYAQNFVDKFLLKSVENIRSIYEELADYKTMLQEMYQASGKSVKYIATELNGNNNTIQFEVSVVVDDCVLATAIGSSKKIAEQKCAKIILERNGGIL